MKFKLKTGTLDTSSNLDAWIITSEFAAVEGNEDIQLQQGDIIKINGDVYRGNEYLGNLA